MDENIIDFSISSNWDTVNGDKLDKTVSVSSFEKKKFDFESVTVDRCVCLFISEDVIPKTKPVIELTSGHLLKQINILSEGNFVEVFGEHSEYLFSCISDFVDDWNGMAVYHTQIELPNVNRCEIKFKRIKDHTRFWIYNIQLLVVKPQKLSNSTFNFENVNNLVKNLDQEMSKNALNFKNLFEMYLKSSSENKCFSCQTINIQDIMGKALKNKFPPLKEKNSEQIFKSVNQSNEEIENKNTWDIFNPVGHQTFEENSINRDLVEDIKSYVDVQLRKIKDDIMRGIEEKLNRLEEENHAKLDEILQMLLLLNNKTKSIENETASYKN